MKRHTILKVLIGLAILAAGVIAVLTVAKTPEHPKDDVSPAASFIATENHIAAVPDTAETATTEDANVTASAVDTETASIVDSADIASSAEETVTESEMPKADDLKSAGKYYVLSTVNGFSVDNPIVEKMVGGNVISVWLSQNKQFAFFCGTEYATGKYDDTCLYLGGHQVPYQIEGNLLNLTLNGTVFSCPVQSDTFPDNTSPMSNTTKDFVKELVG